MSEENEISEKGNSLSWSHRRREVGAILWSSFLAACVAALFFFGKFDPSALATHASSSIHFTSPMAGYAVGFFFFWFTAAIAAVLTAVLLRTSNSS